MKKSIISAHKLCRIFTNNGLKNKVLNGIDVEVYEGDFTVIMGASGSGKSTLLYCLSGMDKATSGSVIFNNNDITTYSEKHLSKLRRDDVGFVFQQIHLVSNLTGFENVAVPGYLSRKVTPERVRMQVKELIERVGVAKLSNRLPSQMSGGEQQRIAVARALINNPVLLFADEPTGALNLRNGMEILDLLNEFNKTGQSILMVTHDIRAALRADRILYLQDGEIVGDLNLPSWNETEIKAREEQVNSWLASLKW